MSSSFDILMCICTTWLNLSNKTFPNPDWFSSFRRKALTSFELQYPLGSFPPPDPFCLFPSLPGFRSFLVLLHGGSRLSLSPARFHQGAKTVVPSEDYSHGPP